MGLKICLVIVVVAAYLPSVIPAWRNPHFTDHCIGGPLDRKCRANCQFTHGGSDRYTGFCQNAVCMCSDNPTEVRCGGDGRFFGISCPFDSYACRAHCCRQGRTGGRCTGFLGFKCRCD